jgi:glycosyltransferase involved in cell wall biosynthesis
MKIAICTNHYAPSVGGSEYVTGEIANYLAASHEVFVFTEYMQGRDKTKLLPVRVVDFLPRQGFDFMKKLQLVNPDVILIYSDKFNFFKELAVQPVKLKSRIIVALCGANYLYANASVAVAFIRNSSRISAIVCHSELTRDFGLCSDPGLVGKTHIIPNGVHLSEFENLRPKAALASEYNLDPSKKWIINVSNFFPGKGQHHIFSVRKQMKQHACYIQVANDIPFSIGEMLESDWKKLAKGQSDVHLLKNLSRKTILSLLRASNLFLFTSEKEEAPIVMLESMASELPWVAGNVGNVESLRGGICIRLPKTFDYYSVYEKTGLQSFADAADTVLDKPTLGREGRTQVEERFNWSRILPQYQSLVEQ